MAGTDLRGGVWVLLALGAFALWVLMTGAAETQSGRRNAGLSAADDCCRIISRDSTQNRYVEGHGRNSAGD